MKRIALIVFWLLVLDSAPLRAAEDCAYRGEQPSTPAELKRGVNLSQWWEKTTFNALSAGDLRVLRATGFDFVRLPVSPLWPLLRDDTERAETLAQLRCDIVSILNAGLAVIVDLHDTGAFNERLAAYPEKAEESLENIWRRLQTAVAGLPPSRVLLGLYNEPGIDVEAWWKIQERLVKNLRPLFPHHTFVVAAGMDSGPWNLVQSEPYADNNLIYDFHFYLPMYFTHHAAEWLEPDDPDERALRVPYPVDPAMEVDANHSERQKYVQEGWTRNVLAGYLRKIGRWQQRTGARVACLEFGVYRPYVDDESRHNWLRDMRELLEAKGFPWALWEYRGVFGLLDGHNRRDEGMVSALGLRHNPEP